MLTYRANSKAGFLLFEVVVACALMTLMLQYLVQYQWHTCLYNVCTSRQIHMLLCTHRFFEEKWYNSHEAGEKKCTHGISIYWHRLSPIDRDAIALSPIRITCKYTIAGTEHSFNILSAVCV